MEKETPVTRIFIFALDVFYAPGSKEQGHIVYIVCYKLNLQTYYFLVTSKLLCYKAHIWYKGTSCQYASPGTKMKVIY